MPNAPESALASSSSSKTPTPFFPQTLDELVKATPAQIAACDFARMALLCATGLPGAEDVGVEKYLRVLDAWTVRIRKTVKSSAYIFDKNLAKYHNSKAKHWMSVVAAVLHDNYRVRYQPDKVGKTQKELPDEVWYLNSRDFMLHGVLGGNRAGTCASMPMLMVSVARRLGFPVNLMQVPHHLLCRWDDPITGERFNFDWNGDGAGSSPDEYYYNWPVKWTGWMHEAQKRLNIFFRSLTGAEALGRMLSERGACLEANGRKEEALVAFDAAERLFPNHYLFARQAGEVAQRIGVHPISQGRVTWGLPPAIPTASAAGLFAFIWGFTQPLVDVSRVGQEVRR